MGTRWGLWLRSNFDILLGGNAVAFNNRAVCYVDAEKFALAVRDLDRALQLDRNLAIAYNNRAAAYCGLEDYKNALADAEMAIRLDPQLLDAYAFRAQARRMLGDASGAMQDLELVLARQPEHATARLVRAQVRITQRQFDQAAADCEAVLRVQPKEFFAWVTLATLQVALRRTAEAKESATRAISLRPQSLDARSQLIYAQLLSQQSPAALAEAELCLRMAPNSPVPHCLLGRIRHELGELQPAIEHYTRAIALDPPPATYSNRGFAHFQLGHYPEALADYEAEIRLNPHDAVVHNNRGRLFHLQGRYAEARHDYEAAMQRDPYHPNAYKNLAWLQATCPEAEFRHAGEALRNIQQAIELDGGRTAQWFEILAAAYAEAGDFESALQWLEKSPETASKNKMQDTYRRREPWREPAQQAIAAG